MPDTNDNYWTKGKILIAILGLFIAGFVFFFLGAGTIIAFIQSFLFIAMILGMLFGIAAIFYWFFIKPQKQDITYMNKKKILEAAAAQPSKNLGHLILSGDAKWSTSIIGRIVSVLRIQVYDEPNQNGEPKVMEEDVFVVQNKKFPATLWANPLVIRVRPQDHSDLVGDVYLKGYNLVKHSEYFYLNNQHLNTLRIDYNILQEAKRGVMFLMLQDLKNIVDQAIGINPRHNIGIEQQKLLKMPVPPPQRPEI